MNMLRGVYSQTQNIKTYAENKITELETKVDNIIQDNPFKDKWISIFGDSISTFKGYVPSKNEYYYPDTSNSEYSVKKVTQTWWHQLLTRLGAKLCVNDSWSGRTVTNYSEPNSAANRGNLHRVTGQPYMNLDGTTEIATEDQYPDVILIMLGVNDFNRNCSLGNYEAKNYTNTSTTTEFYVQYNVMLMSICGVYTDPLQNYPNAQVYCLQTTFSTCNTFPPKNQNNVSQIEFNQAIEQEATLYSSKTLHTYELGVYNTNAAANYVDSQRLHPNTKMMTKIANKCYNEMLANNCF